MQTEADTTPRPPTPYTAAKLLSEEVKDAIGGAALKVQLELRPEFDGNRRTILYNVEVVWSRDGTDSQREWGTHSGAVGLVDGDWVASIFWGHYGLTEEAAFGDRANNRGRMVFEFFETHLADPKPFDRE